MISQDNIFFILYKPAVPGNIGSCARAMKTMGFTRLRLIDPAAHLSDEAKMFGHGSHDILESATLFDSFEEAVQDLDFIISTTANTDKKSKVDYISSNELGEFLIKKQAYAGKTGVVFGTEESGLPSEILRKSNIGLTIPMHGQYPSLNLSQAVMVIAYELHRSFSGDSKAPAHDPQPEASWQALQSQTDEILEKAGIRPPTPLYHRIIERMSFLSGSDAKLVHSIVSKLQKLFNS